MSDDDFAEQLTQLVQKTLNDKISVFKLIGMLDTLKASLINNLLEEQNVNQ